jgi:hypothetical protein
VPASTVTSAAATVPSVERVAAVRERLLTGRDVGNEYTAGAPYSNRNPQPGPCGKPTMQTRYPTYRDVEVHLESEEDEIVEHVMVYAQAAAARQPYAAAVAEFACERGSFPAGDGTSLRVTVGAAVDVTAAVGADQASMQVIRAAGEVYATVVTIRLDDLVIEIISGIPGSAPSDTVAVAKTAVSRLSHA